MTKVKTQLIIEGKNNSKKAFDEVNSQLEGMNKKLATAGKALVAAFSVSQLTGAIRGIAQTADAYNLMNARLKLATGSQEEFNTAQSELKRIAKETQSPVESLITLYGRISRPLKEAGRSQTDIIKVTEAVANAFRVSGASAEEAQNGVIQFAQALGSGALRGDEFNSVAEQAPRLMQALADGIGVPVGALKEMAAQGLLTADVVTNALTSQLTVLKNEAASLPKTVGGAMTELSDRINETIGQADVQPLIDSIEQLGNTLSDPVVRDNLILLASALTQLAAAAASAAAGTVDIGKDLGYIAARVTGNIDEIDRARKELEYFEAAANGFGLLDTYMTDEQINKGLQEWRAYLKALTDEQAALNGQLSALNTEAASEADKARQQELDARSKYVGELKRLSDQQVTAATAAIKKQQAAEKAALAASQKIKEERLEIEEKYTEAFAQLGGGAAGGEPSYANAQALKVGARNALQAGDAEGAKRQADAALKILLELQAAGGNTYGLQGFSKELKAIELAANDIEQTAADEKLKMIGVNIAILQAQADELKDLKITPTMDEQATAAVQAQIQALAASLGQTLTIPVQVVSSGATDEYKGAQGFATGGLIRGAGTGTSDSIPALLSNGEYVIRAAAVRRLGKGYLDLVNRGLPIPRFADGGMVDAAMSVTGGGADTLKDWGKATLATPGGDVEVLMREDSFARLLRKESTRRGSPRRN